MKILDKTYDGRSQCVSVMTTMTLNEYKNIIFEAYESGGNVDGQRDVIKTTTAYKIKKRMEDDFLQGAVFPSVVIGIIIDDIKCIVDADISKLSIDTLVTDKTKIALIDGMQRSYIYFKNINENEDRKIRVEFWISEEPVKLIYRMLVLNTGQVPWNTRRQIEVMYANLADSILATLSEEIPELIENVAITGIDEKKKRTSAGQYQKSNIIRLFLGFNTRKLKVETSEQLAEEYQRFDMMESLDNNLNFKLFIRALSWMIKLDFAFNSCQCNDSPGQFTDGKSIFSSIPACLGFIVACAENVLGKAGIDRTDEIKKSKEEKLVKQINTIIEFVNGHKNERDFLRLEVLNEMIARLSKARIGDEMRTYFKNVFSSMLSYDSWTEIDNLQPIWLSE